MNDFKYIFFFVFKKWVLINKKNLLIIIILLLTNYNYLFKSCNDDIGNVINIIKCIVVFIIVCIIIKWYCC